MILHGKELGHQLFYLAFAEAGQYCLRMSLIGILLFCLSSFAGNNDTHDSLFPVRFSLHRGSVYREISGSFISGWLQSYDSEKQIVSVKTLPPYDAIYQIDVSTLSQPELKVLKRGLKQKQDRFLVVFSDFDPEMIKKFPGPNDITIKELDPVRPSKYITVEELVNLAKTSSSLDDFVLRIPQGALKEFVLGFKTGSPQGASYECPRVLRFNDDASLTISYRGCGHKSDPSVDVIQFDQGSRDLKFSQFIFGKSGVIISKNLTSECSVCHQSNNRTFPSYIWTGYPRWQDFYGSAYDSYLDKGEMDKFLNFRRNQAKSIPAYSSLHWSEEDELFPFAVASRDDTDTLNRVSVDRRTNKILTAVLSTLKAKQIAGVIERHPGFNRIKYLLLMDTLRCEGRQETLAELSSALVLYTGKKVPLTQEPFIEPFLGDDGEPTNEAANIYRVSRALGLSAEDWNIAVTDVPTPYFQRHRPNYNFGAFQLSANVIGNILKDVARADLPDLKPHLRFLSEISARFGRTSLLYGGTFAEVEALSVEQRKRVCGILKARHDSLGKVFAQRDSIRKRKAPLFVEELTFNVDAKPISVAVSLDEPLLNRAAKGFGQCIACHARGESAPQISFDDPKDLAERLRRPPFAGSKPTLLEEIIVRINSRNMPPDGNMSESDREAVIKYLLAFEK